ncbi:hypothetical protein DVH24_027791 [Malus domestica]|uniref:Uncharacterized protein n=1 Tax=Malus domestica TaxID=3750 RepID=A0A498HBL5_MALDO|nr:hypothetical protein DVH24_027791 [Malus domestica]
MAVPYTIFGPAISCLMGFGPFSMRLALWVSKEIVVSNLVMLQRNWGKSLLPEPLLLSVKDVKVALIDSNWDIGQNPFLPIFVYANLNRLCVCVYIFLNPYQKAAQKELRRREKVLASKKSSRMAAEGLLALAQN